MKTELSISEAVKKADYFPSLFANKNRSVIVLADSRTGERTFSGMIIHSDGANKKCCIGMYSTGWTYEQFSRLPKGTNVIIGITQDDE